MHLRAVAVVHVSREVVCLLLPVVLVSKLVMKWLSFLILYIYDERGKEDEISRQDRIHKRRKNSPIESRMGQLIE